ncbi:anti-sigma-D factor RsdA [Mycolicibacterium parafortuitum]|uniref:Anti-sigma-D factor RsdA n=1 Tax=Mycolicibacterium parafortuitum TaxID=39692 RepID=A0A375YH78_MYCPF|nr:anti-sigma-D factor RsdA [Mycolicibacterium parafortuitum]ORB27859.1 hypothetical protein BST38_23195 [Mycolicibacterium parafortuitum]SRX80471.1 Anti-sigma-D factor RsdA [Mycolicibacterium parafortuitum]
MPDFGRPEFGRGNSGGDPSLHEINRIDQMLDALGAQQQPYVTDHAEAELAQLLAGWRDDVRETPMGHVATPQQAEAALYRTPTAKPSGPGRRFSLALVGSAAAAVLAIGGFGAVVAGSGPGDALYGMRTMLFGEQTQTRDDAVILAAQTEMQQVQQLIEQGDWQGAQAKLEAVTTTVATVGDVDQKEELIAQWQELTVKVEAQDPVATVPPGAPLPTFPELPAVLLEPGTTSSETTAPSSETTAPSSETTTAPSSETTAPSSETTAPSSGTTAPSSVTTAPSSATPSSSVGATRSSTSVPPTSVPPTSTTVPPTSVPTSTTVVRQSTTVSSPSTPPPTTTVQAPTTTAQAPATTSAATASAETSAPAPAEEPAPSPTAAVPTTVVPTTTTPLLLPGVGE